MTAPPSQADPTSPARRTGRPTRAGTQQLNEHLLDVAERHFLAHGFEGASMDRLALEARASKRTIYQRYAGKHALFGAVIERALDRLLTGGVETVEGPTVAARLETLAMRIVDRTLLPDLLALMRVIIAEVDRFPGLAQSLERLGWARLVAVIAEMLRSEVAAGELQLTCSVEDSADQFLGLTQASFLIRALMGGDLTALRAEATHFMRRAVPLFLHGCCPADRAPADRERNAPQRRPRVASSKSSKG